jgi:L-cysteine S-thiosulfotransferase
MTFRNLIATGFLIGGFLSAASALAQDKTSPAAFDKMEAAVKATFSRATPEWRKRIELDETQRLCTLARNNVSAADADAIQKREAARVVMPSDGKFLGDWKKGFAIANSGRGGQFSDDDKTVNGGNCYACHQMDLKEVSYGTLGPSLAAYGKDRKYDEASIKDAWTKIYNSQAVVACSNMPRFGVTKFLDEQQMKAVMAYLFDPNSPANK